MCILLYYSISNIECFENYTSMIFYRTETFQAIHHKLSYCKQFCHHEKVTRCVSGTFLLSVESHSMHKKLRRFGGDNIVRFIGISE